MSLELSTTGVVPDDSRIAVEQVRLGYEGWSPQPNLRLHGC